MAALESEMTITVAEAISLRDHFAGQALPMLVDIGHDEDWSPAHVAKQAYLVADAMLAARVATGGSGSNQ